MSKPATLANTQSISAQMAAGNTQHRQRILALLKDHAPKINHHFCPATLDFEINQAGTDKTRRISRAAI